MLTLPLMRLLAHVSDSVNKKITMVKVNLGGCSSFVKDADYKVYVEKALAALEVLENETGKGNDFLGWKHLPSERCG